MKHNTAARFILPTFVLAALLASIPASACQLVCMQTNTQYDGNLGGVAGADAKCAAEFTGFKFARSPSITTNLAGFYSTLSGWVAGSNQNCTNWTTNSSGVSGAYVNYGDGTVNYPMYYKASSVNCSYAQPILCCNM